MGVTIEVDAAKSVRNIDLLVVMRVRPSQRIGLLDLRNQTQFKNETAIKYVQKLWVITGGCVYCYIRSLCNTVTQMFTSWGCGHFYIPTTSDLK